MELDSILKSNFDYHELNNHTSSALSMLPENIEDLPNIIIYGSPGTGKYTESLKIIKKYSNSDLKYSKRLLISNAKAEIYIKISDIHFEIDMELLGCNAKLIWNDVFYNIIDIIVNNDNRGIILCRNFHAINNELLDIFYSYMQSDIFAQHSIRFIILTEAMSYLPNAIVNACTIISRAKFNKTFYKDEFGVNVYANNNNTSKIKSNDIDINVIDNLKALRLSNKNAQDLTEIAIPHAEICDTLVDIIVSSIDNVNFGELRRILYDILVYNLNIHDCIYCILSRLITSGKINNSDETINTNLLETTYHFFKYYNNNYRPIYHLENYLLYLIKLVHRDEL